MIVARNRSFVGASFESPLTTSDVTGVATTRMLETVRNLCPNAKFYFSATSEQLGKTGTIVNRPLNENDYFYPISPYAAAKLYGYWVTRIYREGYGIFAVNGILFNHESPLRGLEFVTRKITNEVAKIRLDLSKELRLGSIEAMRDWGYAPEYVESMWLMLQQDQPDDYVIATGETHSVKEFVQKTFNTVGLDWQKFVKIDKRFQRPLDVPWIAGDYSRAMKKLGWKSKTAFEKLVEIMTHEDLSRWERWNKGEKFPWDAPNYPSEAKILTRALRM